jgi:hypothetical protein
VPSLQFGPAANVSMGVLAWSGTPITTVATLLPAALDAMVTTYPCAPALHYILLSEVTYGNYVGQEAAYQAALGVTLDALHAKYQSALIYVSRTWHQGADAESDDWAARIGVEVAARPDFARLGDDERVWGKGADNGATNYSDGTHYSVPAGVNAKADAVKAVLGY